MARCETTLFTISSRKKGANTIQYTDFDPEPLYGNVQGNLVSIKDATTNAKLSEFAAGGDFWSGGSKHIVEVEDTSGYKGSFQIKQNKKCGFNPHFFYPPPPPKVWTRSDNLADQNGPRRLKKGKNVQK